jgi:Pectate lyase superfamily protein
MRGAEGIAESSSNPRNAIGANWSCADRPLAALAVAVILLSTIHPSAAAESGRMNLLDYAPRGTTVDRHGKEDASPALQAVVKAANEATAQGEKVCVYIPAGVYRIKSPPPMFYRAGCVVGDGSSQTILKIDPEFAGDLFSWSEAWWPTTPGPTARGLKIGGDRKSTNLQNAFVFYDRNDQIFLDDIEVDNLHGRALFSGAPKTAPQAYMRESHLRSLRFLQDGAPGIPVVEFTSAGTGNIDATNEIAVSQLDIYGAAGPSLVIRNHGSGVVRNLTFESLRIEGPESGDAKGDLLDIGDTIAPGRVNSIHLTNVELIDPQKGFCALRITARPRTEAPYQLSFEGMIGGGAPHGNGICIDAGRSSTFRLSSLHTLGTNIVVGPHVSQIELDGGGAEPTWSTNIDPTSTDGITHPVLQRLER